MSVKVTADTKVLDGMLNKLDPRAEGVIKETAFTVLGGAIMRARVDTGALRNSMNAEQESKHMWRVQDGVSYGLFQELGTYKMAAQPFLVPSVEEARVMFSQRWAVLFRP